MLEAFSALEYLFHVDNTVIYVTVLQGNIMRITTLKITSRKNIQVAVDEINDSGKTDKDFNSGDDVFHKPGKHRAAFVHLQKKHKARRHR